MSFARITIGLLAATLLVVLTGAPAGAGIYLNTVRDVAEIGAGGHRLAATVVVGCDEGERLRFRVTVAQGDTVGVGYGAGRCDGAPDGQTYDLTVAGARGATFEPGPAEVHAWAETRHARDISTRTWTKEITIEQ